MVAPTLSPVVLMKDAAADEADGNDHRHDCSGIRCDDHVTLIAASETTDVLAINSSSAASAVNNQYIDHLDLAAVASITCKNMQDPKAREGIVQCHRRRQVQQIPTFGHRNILLLVLFWLGFAGCASSSTAKGSPLNGSDDATKAPNFRTLQTSTAPSETTFSNSATNIPLIGLAAQPNPGPTPTSVAPTRMPTLQPTVDLSSSPSGSPTYPTTYRPTNSPTQKPTLSARSTPLIWPISSPPSSTSPMTSPTSFPSTSNPTTSKPSVPVQPDNTMYYIIAGSAVGGGLLLLVGGGMYYKRKLASPPSLPQDTPPRDAFDQPHPTLTMATATTTQNYVEMIESRHEEDGVSSLETPHFGEGANAELRADETVTESMIYSEAGYVHGVGRRERISIRSEECPSIWIGNGIDDNTLDDVYRTPQICTVVAPSGKLGIFVDDQTQTGDMLIVHAIKETSVLKGRVKVGDLLISVDEINCRGLSAVQVSRLISSRRHNPARSFVLLRGSGLPV